VISRSDFIAFMPGVHPDYASRNGARRDTRPDAFAPWFAETGATGFTKGAVL
jgi:hypothetical protein